MQTHEVFNQAKSLKDFNAAKSPIIPETLTAFGAEARILEVEEIGALAGSAEVIELADIVEENPPILHTHDLQGNRIDTVKYDPAYHRLMTIALENGLAGAAWADEDPNAHLIRAAKFGVWQMTDAGHGCPVSMSYAIAPALRQSPELSAAYGPLLAGRKYEAALRPPLTKNTLTAGMSMTEKQGGSDVRANTTKAERQGDGTYRLIGHKWFTSAPMSDVYLALAQTDAGLSCFLVPRILEDGTLNEMRIMRLKDKLGNHSNASSEIEYHGATAYLVGEEGKGVKTIVEMVNSTRLDCVIGSAAIMRLGVAHATNHVSQREAFGKKLIDQPLMRNVIADLAIEAEGATLASLWLAHLTDLAQAGDTNAALLRRIGLASSKYYVCKRGPEHAAEALECFGGNGYVEDSGMPKIYREAPIYSIWEGSGNVSALDAVRAATRQPETLEALVAELETAVGASEAYDLFLDDLKAKFSHNLANESGARRIVGEMALAIQAMLLLKYGNRAVADAFIDSRLAGNWGTVYGTLSNELNLDPIIERAMPYVN
ncbi:MAG: acyl-CoA dehydrogenase family protein [Microbacteriaceae bacterium]|nr:acyl-CoA dehydrogenase family protein [Microbacteriaceae bacterium]